VREALVSTIYAGAKLASRRNIVRVLAAILEKKKNPDIITPEPDPEPPPVYDRPFFNSIERQRELIREARSWNATPYRPQSGGLAKKNVQADCVSYVEGVLVNVGAIRRVKWPQYVAHGGGYAMLLLLMESIKAVPGMIQIWSGDVGGPYPPLMVGDIFVRSVKLRRHQFDFHHLAIFIGDNTLLNMRESRGLQEANIFDRRSLRQLQGIFRVYGTK
jgi:hypothetical protein